MADYLGTNVYDKGLEYLANGNELHICSAQPANYAGLAAVDLGVKTSPTIGSPEAAVSGRKVIISAVTDGSVTGDGTAAYYALVYTTGSELLAAADLNAGQVVASGNTFTLTAITITLPAPA
jgi:hypothetical protein